MAKKLPDEVRDFRTSVSYREVHTTEVKRVVRIQLELKDGRRLDEELEMSEYQQERRISEVLKRMLGLVRLDLQNAVEEEEEGPSDD